MTTVMPPAPIDPVARIHVLAAALPGAVLLERYIRAPFRSVWDVVADLEHMAPRYERGLRGVRIVERQGVRLRLSVSFERGGEQPVHARMWPGWCLMQSSTAVAAFAVRPSGDGTLLAHLEHLREPAPGPPADAWSAKLYDEVATIERLALDASRRGNGL